MVRPGVATGSDVFCGEEEEAPVQLLAEADRELPHIVHAGDEGLPDGVADLATPPGRAGPCWRARSSSLTAGPDRGAETGTAAAGAGASRERGGAAARCGPGP